MYALGIESTAHTISVGIVSDECEILANRSMMYRPEEGGIHPREAANHHSEHLPDVIKEAVESSGIRYDDLDIIAFSQGPGLGPCLRTGATAARTLSLSLKKPLVGVNHCIAHIEIGRGVFPDCKDPVLLYVSGGNTQVISFSNGRYRVFGETLDIGIGNMLDKFGRAAGMPFPAGKILEKYASKGTELLQLPYSVKGMDMAFSGIGTAALQHMKNGASMEDVSYSLQEVTFAMLTEVTERAMGHLEKTEVLLGGGVAQNSRLKEMVSTMAEDRGADFYVPERSLCADNGAMIAWTGLIMNKAGITTPIEESNVMQKFRTDEVEIMWIE